MVENLKCLAHKKGELPSPAVHAPVKTEVTSPEIMDIDEASTENNTLLETALA